NAWRVVTQASPDPFVGQTRFAFLPFDYANLQVNYKSEAQYLADKSPESKQDYLSAKEALEEVFSTSLIEGVRGEGIQVQKTSSPGDASFVIRPFITYIAPGFYGHFEGNRASEVQMTLRITKPDGQVLDEVALRHSTDAGLTGQSSGDRLRGDGAGL